MTGGGPAPDTPPLLRLGTGNAASGRSRPGRPYDVAPWAAAAATLDVDVLAVQEVDHSLPRSGTVHQTALVAGACAAGREGVPPDPPWSARFTAAVLGTPGSHRTMRPAPGELSDSDLAAAGGYGVALLSRHRVEEWHELRMAPSTARMPVPDEQRVAVAAVLKTAVGPVTVVTTHLSFVPRRAAAQLREVVAWSRSLPRPLVLMGDLNLPGPVPARITGWTPGLRARTFPAPRPLVQLDHVLLDPGHLPVHLAGARTHRLAASDHLAVTADLVGGHPDGP